MGDLSIMKRREMTGNCWSGRGAALFRLLTAGGDAGRRLVAGGQA